MPPLSRLFRILTLLLLPPLAGISCSNVAFHEKKELDRAIMQMDGDAADTAFRNKVQASRECSGAMPGHAAGGGCGCN